MKSFTSPKLVKAIQLARRPEGNNAPRIADVVIGVCFPDTVNAANKEGAFGLFRNGVVAFVRQFLKGSGEDDDTQLGMWEIEPGFEEVADMLPHGEYYVPSLGEFVPKGRLFAFPHLLDEARKFIRAKGEECIAEADRLDEAYVELMRRKGGAA